MANKVKFGLSRCYYAVWNETADTYGAPVALPGAVNLNLDQQGGETVFRADNVDYWVTFANGGYSGSLELAGVPESFRTDVLGELNDATNAIRYELGSAQPQPFALLFQVEGDDEAIRFAFYNCKCSRPSVASQTTEADAINPVTDTLNITAKARPVDDLIKGVAVEGSTSYADWFTAVKKPTL